MNEVLYALLALLVGILVVFGIVFVWMLIEFARQKPPV